MSGEEAKSLGVTLHKVSTEEAMLTLARDLLEARRLGQRLALALFTHAPAEVRAVAKGVQWLAEILPPEGYESLCEGFPGTLNPEDFRRIAQKYGLLKEETPDDRAGTDEEDARGDPSRP